MGNCGCQSQRKTVVTTNVLLDLLHRIRLSSEQYQLHGERALKQQEQLLVQVFGQTHKNRNLMTEKAMINRTVFAKNMLTIYQYITTETKVLLERRALFDLGENYDALIPSINLLVYCSAFLQDENLTKFTALIRDRFPSYRIPEDADIRYNLVRHHRYTEEVTLEMENDFVMEFCVEKGISLAVVNEVGHQYHYGASRAICDE